MWATAWRALCGHVVDAALPVLCPSGSRERRNRLLNRFARVEEPTECGAGEQEPTEEIADRHRDLISDPEVVLRDRGTEHHCSRDDELVDHHVFVPHRKEHV